MFKKAPPSIDVLKDDFNKKLKQIRTEIPLLVGEKLSSLNFLWDKKNKCFVKKTSDDRIEKFYMVFKDAPLGYLIQLNMGVRFESVEHIFHQTSLFDKDAASKTSTIGASIGLIKSNKADADFVSVSVGDDLTVVIKNILLLFNKYAIPYYENFKTIQDVDIEINEKRSNLLHRGVPWLSLSTGIIAAKLTKRFNYGELKKEYSDIVKKTSNGLYYERFQKLLESLETVRG